MRAALALHHMLMHGMHVTTWHANQQRIMWPISMVSMASSSVDALLLMPGSLPRILLPIFIPICRAHLW